jgi:putative membrane protein insertion efficiency factor
MVLLLRICIRAYQWTLSPFLAWLGGPATGCRFHPTCSVYFLEAVERHGLLRGSWLGLKRIVRCQPWGGQGNDPVPPLITANATSHVDGFVCE